MERRRTKLSFWIAITLFIAAGAIAVLWKMYDYNKSDKLKNEGKRILLPVDSLIDIVDGKQIFVTLKVGDKVFALSQEIKNEVAVGDSVTVYYLEENPSENMILIK